MILFNHTYIYYIIFRSICWEQRSLLHLEVCDVTQIYIQKIQEKSSLEILAVLTLYILAMDKELFGHLFNVSITAYKIFFVCVQLMICRFESFGVNSLLHYFILLIEHISPLPVSAV